MIACRQFAQICLATSNLDSGCERSVSLRFLQRNKYIVQAEETEITKTIFRKARPCRHTVHRRRLTRATSLAANGKNQELNMWICQSGDEFR